MKHILLSTFSLAALFVPALAAENWVTDLPTALTQATKENKAVMVDFNGSDWCGPCITLKEKVLATPAFEAYAKDKFILVDIDVPKGDKLTAEQKKINQELGTKYAVKGYPTVLVLNKEGYILGGFVGSTDKLDKVTGALDAALAQAAAVDAALVEAKPLSGEAKAKALMKAYELVPEGVRENNVALKKEIMANDPNDACGFVAADKAKKEVLAKARAAQMANRRAVDKLLEAVPAEKLQEAIDEFLVKPDLPQEQKVILQWKKFDLVQQTCETEEDIAAMKKMIEDYGQSVSDEQEKTKVKQVVAMFFSRDPKEILELAKKSREYAKKAKK